jgi:hypothetical protein
MHKTKNVICVIAKFNKMVYQISDKKQYEVCLKTFHIEIAERDFEMAHFI